MLFKRLLEVEIYFLLLKVGFHFECECMYAQIKCPFAHNFCTAIFWTVEQ